jgi:hypothetical protein
VRFEGHAATDEASMSICSSTSNSSSMPGDTSRRTSTRRTDWLRLASRTAAWQMR